MTEMTEIIKVMPPATAKSPISPQRVCFAFFYGFYLGFYRHYRGIPVKRISESLFCLFFSFFFPDKRNLRVVFFVFLFWFLQVLQGGPLINVFLRIYFALCFLFFFVFFFLINVFLRVYLPFFFNRHYRGTPVKRISEGLFCPLCYFFGFWGFIGIIGGTPDKRISEGLFCPFLWYLFGFLQALQGGPL